MAINFMAVQELSRQYNDDPRSFSDQEAEMIANLTQQFGLDFQRTSRPGAKGAFDAADMATFGMLPNQWRPESRGDTVLGESGIDEVGGGVGTLAGLGGAGGVLSKGAQAARGAVKRMFNKGGASEIVRKSAEGVTSSRRGLLPAPPQRGQSGSGSLQLDSGSIPLGASRDQNLLQLTGTQGFSATDAGLVYDQLRPF